jgi:hypothetical protein
MRIDRYVHDERLTWGAAAVLLVVTALHAAGIGRLLLAQLEPPQDELPPPVFQVSLLKLPPPRLPDEVQQAPDTATDRSAGTAQGDAPVPLVDTPRILPPDTQVNNTKWATNCWRAGPRCPRNGGRRSLRPPSSRPPTGMKLLDMKPPVYPPRRPRMGSGSAPAGARRRYGGSRTRPATAARSTRQRPMPRDWRFELAATACHARLVHRLITFSLDDRYRSAMHPTDPITMSFAASCSRRTRRLFVFGLLVAMSIVSCTHRLKAARVIRSACARTTSTTF